MVRNFTSQEEEDLRQRLARGSTPPCPRCGGPLSLTPVPPRSDVAYVRERILVLCTACRSRTVVDRL